MTFLLSACGNTPNNAPTPTSNLPKLGATPTPQEVIEVPDPTIKAITPDQDADVAAIEPAPEVINVNDDPQQFITLDIYQLSKLLGAPLLVRRDGTAEVWQYKNDACTLDIFLYEEETKLRVKYVDLRGDTNDAGNRACMAEILRAHIRHMS